MLKVPKYPIPLSFILFALFSSPIFADRIAFKDGTQVECMVQGQSKGNVIYMVGNQQKTAQKKSLKSIHYEETASEKEEKKENTQKIREMQKQIDSLKSNGGSVQRLTSLLGEFEAEARKREAEIDKKQREREKLIQLLSAEEGYSKSEEDRSSPDSFNSLSSLWRSVLVPGWGQYYQGRKWQGGLILGTVATGGLYAATEQRSYFQNNRSLDQYRNQGYLIPGEASYLPLFLYNQQRIQNLAESRSKHAKSFNLSLAILAGVYLYNLFDSYYFSINTKTSSKNTVRDDPNADILIQDASRNIIAQEQTIQIDIFRLYF